MPAWMPEWMQTMLFGLAVGALFMIVFGRRR